MNRTLPFRYPLSGVLIARLARAMGFGPKSWPKRPGRPNRAGTLKRLLAGEPPTFVLSEFIDDALGLLGSPSGRWQLGPASLSRGEVFERLYTGLRAYDKAASELNASKVLLAAERRHALPVLTLLAVRLGAIVGVLAAIRREDVDDFWKKTPLDRGAFNATVRRLVEQALPDMNWRDRGDASPLGKNVLDRWCKHPPGESFKFPSLKKFAGWIDGLGSGDAADIEWHLRWLAAGARLWAELDAYLGRDGHGERWLDRLLDTAKHHARLNHALYTEKAGLDEAIGYLDPARREAQQPEHDRMYRRVFAWVVGRAEQIDVTAGPELSDEEMTQLHTTMRDDAGVRAFVWTRLAAMHALGFPTPGIAEVLAGQRCLELYTVQFGRPASYLKQQHELLAVYMASAGPQPDRAHVDDQIAAGLKLVFTEARALTFHGRLQQELAPLLADPAAFAQGLAVAGQVVALQHAHAGLPVAAPPVGDVADPDVREFLKVIELQRILPGLLEKGDKDAITRVLEDTVREFPDLVEPAAWLTQMRGEQLLEQGAKLTTVTVQLRVLLSPAVGPTGPAAHAWYRKLIAIRRALPKLQRASDTALDAILGELEETAARAGDRWPIDLARFRLAGQRATIDISTRRQLASLGRRPGDEAAVRSLQSCVESLHELHRARPEHPEPCLWLARFHALLGDQAEARRWGHLAEQRGELAGAHAAPQYAGDARRPRTRRA